MVYCNVKHLPNGCECVDILQQVSLHALPTPVCLRCVANMQLAAREMHHIAAEPLIDLSQWSSSEQTACHKHRSNGHDDLKLRQY